jgi:hypothetical protein
MYLIYANVIHYYKNNYESILFPIGLLSDNPGKLSLIEDDFYFASEPMDCDRFLRVAKYHSYLIPDICSLDIFRIQIIFSSKAINIYGANL